MSKSTDKKLFKKYFTDGCSPSPADDRDYTVDTVALASAPLPKTYLQSGMKVLNQGNVGRCVAHACATAMGYGEKLNGMKTVHDFSRGFIYGNRRILDHQGEGMYIRQALKQLNHCGDCEYKDFPYNETYPQVKNRIEQDKENLLNKAAPFKIINYFRCYSNNDVKRALLGQGAVVISIPVYDSFASECPLPSPTDQYLGGHAMCIVGWDETGWIIQNSWSNKWGNNGNMHLPYEYPISEFWGITINTNFINPENPKSKKENWIIEIKDWTNKIVNIIINFFKSIFNK